VLLVALGGDVLDVLNADEDGMEGKLLVEVLFDGMRRLGCGRGGVIIVVCCCCCDVGGGG
jgi:hypothetical protein